MENRRIGGECIAPRTAIAARGLTGKKVEYLRSLDIDKSGRGYFFPKVGIVERVIGRNIEISGSWIGLSELVEMRVVSE